MTTQTAQPLQFDRNTHANDIAFMTQHTISPRMTWIFANCAQKRAWQAFTRVSRAFGNPTT